MDKTHELIKNIIEKVGNTQMEWYEYEYITRFLGNINLLVFGTGHDSELWRWSNRDGKTIFLENDDKWIDSNRKDIIKINYTCKITEYKSMLEEFKSNKYDSLTIDIPSIVSNEKWDVIFVDSPTGYSENCHGRMQSIFSALMLSNKNTDIFIHDCNRPVEDLYSRTMFKIINNLSKLRHLKRCNWKNYQSIYLNL